MSMNSMNWVDMENFSGEKLQRGLPVPVLVGLMEALGNKRPEIDTVEQMYKLGSIVFLKGRIENMSIDGDGVNELIELTECRSGQGLGLFLDNDCYVAVSHNGDTFVIEQSETNKLSMKLADDLISGPRKGLMG